MKLNAAGSVRREYAQSARAKSTELTGQRIVAAFLARIMVQWYDEITIDAIARDSGVTVQTVLRRFDGKEGLLGAAAATLATEINAKRAAPPGDVPGMIDRLFTDYERTGDPVIRLLALEGRYPAVKAVTDLGRREHRNWVSLVLAAPLALLDAAAQHRTLDALVIATDVYSWKLLRRDMGRSIAAAKSTMKSLIQAALHDAATLNS